VQLPNPKHLRAAVSHPLANCASVQRAWPGMPRVGAGVCSRRCRVHSLHSYKHVHRLFLRPMGRNAGGWPSSSSLRP
jgi:hypothetical protein